MTMLPRETVTLAAYRPGHQLRPKAAPTN